MEAEACVALVRHRHGGGILATSIVRAWQPYLCSTKCDNFTFLESNITIMLQIAKTRPITVKSLISAFERDLSELLDPNISHRIVSRKVRPRRAQ